jgi:hypothetical protein
MIGQIVKDDQGKLLGHLLSHEEYTSLLRAWVTRPFSETVHEEAKKLIASANPNAGKSTADVLSMLEELENQLQEAGQ